MMSEHVLDFVLFQLRIALRRGDDEVILFFLQLVGEPFGDFAEEGMDEIGHDEADERTAAGDQTARGEVWAVVQMLHALKDFGLGIFGDVGPIAQSARNGDHRNAEFGGYVFQADDHGKSVAGDEGGDKVFRWDGRWLAGERLRARRAQQVHLWFYYIGSAAILRGF